MGQLNRAGKYLVVTWLALCTVSAIPSEKVVEHPDFTGLWTNGPAGPPSAAPASAAPRGGGANLPLTAYGKARREAYIKLTSGTDDSPGNWCVGTGMPGSMMGAGVYPMEIMQRPEQINITYEAHNEARRVFFGERNAPDSDRVPSRSGYSEADGKATRW